jgi:sarcosine oxidase
MKNDRIIVDVDYAVIGLGVMGASTLHCLARSGRKVVGIDKYSPPHGHGASHGYKVTREAVAEGAAYLQFVRRSNEILFDLEQRYQVPLVGRNGTLIIGADASAGSSSFLGDTVRIAQANDIEHELLSSKDLKKLYPQLIGVARNETGYFEPRAGFIRSEPLLNLQIALAKRAGAEIFENMFVNGITPSADGVEIEADGLLIRARQAAIAAGKWTGELLGRQFGSLLSVTQQRTFSFRALDIDAYRPDRFPPLMWFRDSVGGDCVTVFPIDGTVDEVKFFVAETETDPGIGTASDRFYRHHVQPFFGGISPEQRPSTACVYTSTEDHGFLLDWHPDIPGLFLASACSGHGFKHALGIGETVAHVLLGRPTSELSPFSLNRFLSR